MIELRKTNGDLFAPGLEITASLTKSNLLADKNQTIKTGVSNGEYQSFQIPNVDDGEFNFTIYFYRESILFISITLGIKYYSTPFILIKEQQTHLKNVLQYLGGINKYGWGSVEWSEDLKGGVLSIIVKYQQ